MKKLPAASAMFPVYVVLYCNASLALRLAQMLRCPAQGRNSRRSGV